MSRAIEDDTMRKNLYKARGTLDTGIRVHKITKYVVAYGFADAVRLLATTAPNFDPVKITHLTQEIVGHGTHIGPDGELL